MWLKSLVFILASVALSSCAAKPPVPTELAGRWTSTSKADCSVAGEQFEFGPGRWYFMFMVRSAKPLIFFAMK